MRIVSVSPLTISISFTVLVEKSFHSGFSSFRLGLERIVWDDTGREEQGYLIPDFSSQSKSPKKKRSIKSSLFHTESEYSLVLSLIGLFF